MPNFPMTIPGKAARNCFLGHIQVVDTIYTTVSMHLSRIPLFNSEDGVNAIRTIVGFLAASPGIKEIPSKVDNVASASFRET